MLKNELITRQDQPKLKYVFNAFWIAHKQI